VRSARGVWGHVTKIDPDLALGVMKTPTETSKCRHVSKSAGKEGGSYLDFIP
jgi:hypothetical protein